MNEQERWEYVSDLERQCLANRAAVAKQQAIYEHSQKMLAIAATLMADVLAAPWRALAADIRRKYGPL